MTAGRRTERVADRRKLALLNGTGRKPNYAKRGATASLRVQIRGGNICKLQIKIYLRKYERGK